MKKIFIYVAAATAILLAAACQKENTQAAEENVTITVNVPEVVQTKAFSKAESVDVVYYEIWDETWQRKLYPKPGEGPASQTVVGRRAEIPLTLVLNQVYNFIFWAQSSQCDAYTVDNLKLINVDYDKFEGNSDMFDAFYAVTPTKDANGNVAPVKKGFSQSITLYRPFAQLNFGASVMETYFGDVTVESSSVTVAEVPTVFNTLDGIGQAPNRSVTFQAKGLAADPAVETLNTNGQSYTWVTMDYMLVPDAVVTVSASFDLGMGAPVSHDIPNVSLLKNHRTNIIGDLFTTDAILEIIVEPEFKDADQIPNEDIIKPLTR